jgi:uncharacterized protein
VLLDVLRGLALYGVLLANTAAWFSGRALLPQAEAMQFMTPVNIAAAILLGIFVETKAMTLLTFLFGLGFSVQLERAEAQGRSVLPLYFRRLAAMILIGCCHVTLLWWGDILWGYGLTGFALVLFRKSRPRTLLIWAIALVIVPMVVTAIPAVAERLQHVLPAPPDEKAFRAEVLAAMKGDDRLHLMKMQVLHAFYFVSAIAGWYFTWVLGRFLLGYFAGRTRLLHDAPARLPLFRRLFGWGLGIGIVCAGISIARRFLMQRGTRPSPMIKVAFVLPVEIGLVAMAAAYLGAVVLLMQRPAWRRRLMALAPVGQMALTTYLSQSLISTAIFYGWGLGLIGKAGPAICIPITLGIFALQIQLSRWWLARYRFGPMEWVWRTLTYLKLQPMRRLAPDALERGARPAPSGP